METFWNWHGQFWRNFLAVIESICFSECRFSYIKVPTGDRIWKSQEFDCQGKLEKWNWNWNLWQKEKKYPSVFVQLDTVSYNKVALATVSYFLKYHLMSTRLVCIVLVVHKFVPFLRFRWPRLSTITSGKFCHFGWKSRDGDCTVGRQRRF